MTQRDEKGAPGEGRWVYGREGGVAVVFGVVFFFSSRRRHTRSKRDWSSDVCSSDLSTECSGGRDRAAGRRGGEGPAGRGATLDQGGGTVSAKPCVLEFGMGVDVHGRDSTKAACRAVSDAIRHSSLPLFQEVRERGGRMLVDVTVGVPDPDPVKLDIVRRELPHGEVTVHAVSGGLRSPSSDTLIACAAITVSVEYPQDSR